MTVYTASQTILCLADSHGEWIEVTATVGAVTAHPFTIEGTRLRVGLDELEEFGTAILQLVAEERAKAAEAVKESETPEQPTEAATRRTRQRPAQRSREVRRAQSA